MNNGAVWSDIAIPVVTPTGWTRPEISSGLRQLERLRRSLDAAFAALIVGYGANDRDTTAAIVRSTGMSAHVAREHKIVAQVIERIPGAGLLLEHGELSADHLRSLARVENDTDATELLPLAVAQTPEEFALTARRYLANKDGAGTRERQHADRCVRFFNTDNGVVGIRAILTAIEGAELKTRLQQITDAAWRAEHPERAETLGGHGGPPLHQRLADALMKLVHGNTAGTFGKPTVVVVVDAETLEANITGTGPGSGPVPLVERTTPTSTPTDSDSPLTTTTNGPLFLNNNYKTPAEPARPTRAGHVLILDNQIFCRATWLAVAVQKQLSPRRPALRQPRQPCRVRSSARLRTKVHRRRCPQ